MFIVVSYDIVDDRIRERVSKTLLDYGTRVQRSVFECTLDEKKLEEMVARVLKFLDHQQDTLRIYNICGGCLKKIQVFGKGDLTQDEDVYIV